METTNQRPTPYITSISALNALADAVRWYKLEKSSPAKKAMFQALDRAERMDGVVPWSEIGDKDGNRS